MGLRRKGVIERKVLAITEIYNKITTSMRIDGERSEEFEVKVGVHRSSVLSLLLLAMEMDEITKDGREGCVKELLYTDDLVLLVDRWEEVKIKYARWKKATAENGLKVTEKRERLFVLARETSKFPCSICRGGVGRNFILCVK